MTIKLYNYDTGISLYHDWTIKDCDGDDDTCEEYYGLRLGNIVDQTIEFDLVETVKIYDLNGRILRITSSIENINLDKFNNNILIYVYLDIEGNILGSEKNFISNRK